MYSFATYLAKTYSNFQLFGPPLIQRRFHWEILLKQMFKYPKSIYKKLPTNKQKQNNPCATSQQASYLKEGLINKAFQNYAKNITST
jgi:hypothetical protein